VGKKGISTPIRYLSRETITPRLVLGIGFLKEGPSFQKKEKKDREINTELPMSEKGKGKEKS